MPDWRPEIRRQLVSSQRESARVTAIVEEIAEYLDDCYRELIAAGATEAEAERRVLLELNGSERLRRDLRRQEREAVSEPIVLGTSRRANMIADLWQDLRYGARMLMKQPGYTLIAVLTLALGIGANTAMFSVVNAVLLRPLPYPDPARLMLIEGGGVNTFTAPDFIDVATQNRSFATIGAYASATFNLSGSNTPERINSARISASYMPTLGIEPIYGRNISPEEDKEGGEKVVLLGYGLWQRQFGAEPNVVGRVIKLDDQSYTVIGVLPPGLNIPANIEVLTPLAIDARTLTNYEGYFLTLIARLKPGATRQQADAELATIIKPGDRGPRYKFVRVLGLQEALVGDYRTMMLILMGAVGFVALIACANLANLLLTAAARRQKEIAVRLSLGANRGRVVRQLLTESLLLAGLGGITGLLFAFAALALINSILPTAIPRIGLIGIDGAVLGFTTLLTLCAGLLFGTLPALRASQTSLTETLKAGSRSLGGSFSSHRLRAILVVSQVALTVILLTGAGLLIKSFIRLQQTSLGFKPEHILTARIALPRSSYSTRPQRLNFADRLLDEVRKQPGLQEAALTSSLPFASGNPSYVVLMNGQEKFDPNKPLVTANFRSVSPAYFRVMGVPLLRGREFTEMDHARTPMVIIINEAMANRYWPNADPIGQRIKETSNEAAWREIVGIVGSVRHQNRGEEPKPEMFVPWSQVPSSALNLTVRTQVEPASFATALREAVTAADPNLPTFEVRTMEDRLFDSVAQPRFRTTLLAIFAGLALVMSVIGLYAVMTVSVAQRTHELGIRMALGAQQRDVIKMVLRQGVTLVSTGIGIGMIGAWALTRVLTTLLYQVNAIDPLTFMSVPMMLVAVALLACWMPARQAAKVDPLTALRYE